MHISNVIDRFREFRSVCVVWQFYYLDYYMEMFQLHAIAIIYYYYYCMICSDFGIKYKLGLL